MLPLLLCLCCWALSSALLCLDCHGVGLECRDRSQFCQADLCTIQRTIVAARPSAPSGIGPQTSSVKYTHRCADPIIQEKPGTCHNFSSGVVDTRYCYCDSGDFCNAANLLRPPGLTLLPKVIRPPAPWQPVPLRPELRPRPPPQTRPGERPPSLPRPLPPQQRLDNAAWSRRLSHLLLLLPLASLLSFL